jgi:cysteinyl-tRNA synthetase
MAEEAFGGVDFEIHGGGNDLIFPHHENEIAQTEAARGERLAKLWMHNGMLEIGQKKGSKSLGNIRPLAETLDEFGRDTVLMYFVRGHYRKPIDFSSEALDQARRSVERVRELARRLDPDAPGVEADLPGFYAALADDFNTPKALSLVFEAVADANRRLETGERLGPGALREMLWTLGLDGLLDASDDALDPEAVRLLAEREEARGAKDFATADARRDELLALGWEVRDTPEGPRLVRRGT